MIDPEILQELNAVWIRLEAFKAAREATRRALVDILVARFGPQAEEFAAQLERITDNARLKELVKLAAVCPDLESFWKQIGAPSEDMP